MKSSFLVLLFLVLVHPLVAATDTNGDGFITVLIPIAFSPNQILAGTYETQWTGELWAHNATGVDIASLQPYYCQIPIVCPIITFPAGFLDKWELLNTNHNDGGALLYLSASTADEIHLSARLYELTRQAQPDGVDIPVVRENEFFTKPVALLGVPVKSSARSTLRVYDPRFVNGSSVQVEILSPTGEVIETTELSPGDDPAVPDSPPHVPIWHHLPGAAAIHNLGARFPQLQTYSHFNVRITPLTPGMEYWAMVSVTDNETQHVLIITAQ